MRTAISGGLTKLRSIRRARWVTAASALAVGVLLFTWEVVDLSPIYDLLCELFQVMACLGCQTKSACRRVSSTCFKVGTAI